MDTTTKAPRLYQVDRFVARRQVFKLAGAAFHVYDEDGELIGYSKQKAFKLKEDIRVYADEAMSTELLTIKADRVIDFGAAYSVVDATTGVAVGSLRRKGMKSLLRDTWEILDAAGRVRGRVLEDSQWKALLRRFIDFASLLLPQAYSIEADDRPVATIRQHANPLVHKFTVDLKADPGSMPRPLVVAAVVLLLAVEGKQS